MTISKKILLITSFALALPFFTHSFYTLDQERGYILTFSTQHLTSQNSTKMHHIAGWLNNKAIGHDDTIIINLANIINTPGLTTDSKITIFDDMIQKEKRVNRNHTIRGIAETIAASILFAGFAGLTIWAIIEDIKNPRPIVYVKPRPTVTVTYRRKEPTAPIYFSPSWPFITTSYQVYP